MEDVSLAALRAFASVVETGSFTLAAERAGVTQPAISLRVRQLEQRFGVRLIERVGRRARPTAAGTDLLPHVERIEAAVAAARAEMRRHTVGTGGHLRLGTGATACIHLLPPVLRDLRARMPGVEITVRTGNTAEMVRAVEDNLLDVALVTLPASGRMLEIAPVLDDGFVAIASADDAPLPDHVAPGDLAERPIILYEPGGNTRALVDEWLARAGRPSRPVMALGSAEAIKQLVGAGIGVTVLPRTSLGPTGETTGLVARPLSPPLSRTLATVLRKDKPLSPALREMVKALGRLGEVV